MDGLGIGHAIRRFEDVPFSGEGAVSVGAVADAAEVAGVEAEDPEGAVGAWMDGDGAGKVGGEGVVALCGGGW